MGLFTPKISRQQLESVKTLLKQAAESSNLVNSTVKPDVFFGRLGFLLDILLELQKYEKYKIFSGSSPSSDFKKLIQGLDKTVDAFINRSLNANKEKIEKLKTQSAKEKNYKNFVAELYHAFLASKSFWPGNLMYPHYTGPLYSETNLAKVKSLYEETLK